MHHLRRWAAIALIVVGGVGLAMNFREFLPDDVPIDRNAAIAADQTQRAGDTPTEAAQATSGDSDDEQQEIAKRWEFDSGAFRSVSVSADADVHIAIDADTDVDYLELRGRVPSEAARRALQTGGNADGIALDLTASPRIRLFSFGSDHNEVYVTIGLRDADQLENAEFMTGSGSLDFGELSAERMSIKLSSGDLRAKKFEAREIELLMTSGSLKVDELIGPSRIEMSSGDMKIDAIEGDSVIRSTSGSVELKQRLAGNLDVAVSSGDIEIQAAPDFAGVYDARTTSGDIETPDSPGRSGDTIKVRATSGDVEITQ